MVIDLTTLDPELLPEQMAVSSITMAELAAGPHAARSPSARAIRQETLQRAEAAFDPLPFDNECARAYGRVSAAVTSIGRKPRGPRMVDLLLAATACAHGIPLYTRNPHDFVGLDDLIEVIVI